MKSDYKIERIIEESGQWKPLLEKLRNIMLETEMTEEIKWGMPTYSLGGQNLVGVGCFKEYVALWFHQGAILNDPWKVLVNAQPGKTVAMRQWRFESVEDIEKDKIIQYITDAIQRFKQEKSIVKKQSDPIKIPEKLADALSTDKILNMQFMKLSPGKRREFIEYIHGAKRENTRDQRLKKIVPLILKGTGLNDHYRKKS